MRATLAGGKTGAADQAPLHVFRRVPLPGNLTYDYANARDSAVLYIQMGALKYGGAGGRIVRQLPTDTNQS